MKRFHVGAICAVVVVSLPALALAQGSGQPPPKPPVVQEKVEVVATRLPQAPHDVPAAIEVIDGDTLRALGATNLKEALVLAGGVEIAPGGDNGPAGSVPEFWGLREFDAFLLVVDDIPWGGAFNPALTTLNLRDVERVEILRGPAPLTYGATSFVGVIHVVHKPAAATERYLGARAGSFGTGGGSVDLPVPGLRSWLSRLTVDGERQGFSSQRTSFARAHALFRGSKSKQDRKMWFTVDLNLLQQDPASPHPRAGATLSPDVPLDSNHNPAGAFMNDIRFSAAWGMTKTRTSGSELSLSASFSHSGQDILRGFLTDVADTANNAKGLREKLELNDLYVDTHLTWPARAHMRFVAGVDFLHGLGEATGATFLYTAPLKGTPAAVVTAPGTLDLRSEDRREFFGGYAITEWTPVKRVRISGGLRLNITLEERGENETAAQKAAEKEELAKHVRPTGSVGLLTTLWENGYNHVNAYVNYRDTFKPAAVDFGIGEEEAEGVLKPETSRSVDGGVKIRMLDGRFDLEADAFRMNFTNLVTSATVNGVPALINSGKERFSGVELATDLRMPHSVVGRASYSFHDAKFVDFVQEFDPGVPTQLAGKRVEMSARHLFSGGLIVAPEKGVVADLVVKHTGQRFLNKRNTAPAAGFNAIDLGFGYRLTTVEIRLDARNVGGRRDPVAESELGDAQYYRMTARQVLVGMNLRF